MIKAVIVEDEERSLKLLEKLITNYCEDIEVCGTAQDIDTGYELIRKLEPDLVFLDIEMQSATAFELLNKFEHPHFSVIFTTAYEQYAIQAIKYSAIDYLLKPIDLEELKLAIRKAGQKKSSRVTDMAALEVLMHNIRSTSVHQKQIAVPTNTGLHIIKFSDIIYCESDGPYTTFFLKNAGKIVTSKHLKVFEGTLPEAMFYRCHNSYIINLFEVLRYIKADGGQVSMSNQSLLNVSKTRKDLLVQKLHGALNMRPGLGRFSPVG